MFTGLLIVIPVIGSAFIDKYTILPNGTTYDDKDNYVVGVGFHDELNKESDIEDHEWSFSMVFIVETLPDGTIEFTDKILDFTQYVLSSHPLFKDYNGLETKINRRTNHLTNLMYSEKVKDKRKGFLGVWPDLADFWF
jgi:hypothetical protein